MKHLLKALEGRLNVQTSGTDLNQLLGDIRDSKDNKNAENFYDTLEKVLAELRTTDQATAFMRPVRKVEAPDYDLVIKHPMDLQTMQKKVKGHTYKNKQEFSSDLNLIWDNCLTYNSDPNHPLRRAAIFMRKKADHILERITDKNERPQTVNVRMLKPPPAQHYGKSRTIESSDEEDGGTPLANGRTAHLPNGAGANGMSTKMVDGVSSQPGHVNGISKQEEKKTTVLGKRRAGRPDDIPFLERPAIIRTPQSMASFRDVDLEMQRYLDSEGAGPSRLPQNSILHHDIGQRVQKKLKTVTMEEPDPYRSYGAHLGMGTKGLSNHSVKKAARLARKHPSFPTGDASPTQGQLLGGWWQAMADPALQGSGITQLPQSTEPLPPIAAEIVKRKRPRGPKTSTDVLVPGLRGLVQRNITTLRKMRKTHSRLNAIQAGEEPRPPSPPPPDVGLRLKRRSQRGPIPLEGGHLVAKSRLDVIDSMLLEHAGFEGASKGAMNVLSDVAADFVMNLGRTLRFYTDKYGQSMAAEEIILHALFENGTLEVQEMERYIKDDVERYGHKIAELERKLAQTYVEITEPLMIEDDTMFDEGGDALIAGNWTEELGEDFFGFRALGLDKELGMSTLSIPSRLFHGRSKRQDPSAAQAASNEPPPPYPPPPAFIPFANNSIDPPIGLLLPFYREKLEKIGALVGGIVANPDGMQPLPSPSAITLSDDPPDALKVKSGPLGQISQPTAGAKVKTAKVPGPGKGNGKKRGGGSGGGAAEESGTGGPSARPPAAGQGDAGNLPSADPAKGAAPPPGTVSSATPSPSKRKSKASKKKATGGAAGEAPQAGPIVMATA